MYQVKQVSQWSGGSVRPLHRYDAIGLLSFHKHEKGYRYNKEDDMSRLQAILYYRYLGFPLKQIQTLLSATDQDLLPHLRQQLLELRREYER